MNKTVFVVLFSVTGFFLKAQNIGINTLVPKARLQVNGGLLVSGNQVSADSVNTYATGSLMYFNPLNAAFRAGYADAAEWTYGKTGFGSVAFGEGTRASGSLSFASGYYSIASGTSSLAAGITNTADGAYSVALGYSAKASGALSFAAGNNVYAKSLSSFAIGRYNDTTSSSSTGWVGTDPLFIIGNGTANDDRSNAVTVLKDGRVGIGTTIPAYNLTVAQSMNIGNENTGAYYLKFGGASSAEGIGSDRSGAAGHYGLDFYAGLGGIRMKISNNGNVGIGTGYTDPGFQLHVNDVQNTGIPVWIESNNPSSSAVYLNALNPTASPVYGYLRSGIVRANTGVNSSNDWFLNVGFNSNVLYVDSGTGYMGLKNSTPGFPLNFSAVLGDKISVYGNSGNHYGIGIQNNLLQLHTDAATADIAFGYGTSGAFTETARIKGNGKIGLGTTNPLAKLQINQAGNYTAAEGNNHALEIRDASGSNTNFLYMGADNINSVGYIQSTRTGAFQPLALNARGGNVGIGLINPLQKLDVNGNGRFSGDIIVKNDRGIIRNGSAEQLKMVVTALQVSSVQPAYETFTFPLSFSQTFSGAPTVYVANVTANAGQPLGDVEKIFITVCDVTALGCSIRMYNVHNAPVSFNGVWQIVAIGPQ